MGKMGKFNWNGTATFAKRKKYVMPVSGPHQLLQMIKSVNYFKHPN